MNKKGFTLMEVLGVIVIIIIILALVLPNLINSVKNKETEVDNINLNIVYQASDLYVKSNLSRFQEVDAAKYCLELTELVDKDLLHNVKKFNGQDITEDYSVQVSYNVNKFDYELVEKSLCVEAFPCMVDVTVDVPSNFTPVKYNGEEWIVVNTEQEWYNYCEQNWANAVILKSGVTKRVDDVVDIKNDITQMYVYIPRYEYKIEGQYGLDLNNQSGTQQNPGKIEINFINKSVVNSTSDYKIHPAFVFDGTNLSGIWVGKFETSSASSSTNSCENESCTFADNLRIIPGTSAEMYKLLNYFYTIRSMSRSGNAFSFSSVEADVHMIKNIEWGAALYLARSIYGKYGNSDYSVTNKGLTCLNNTLTGYNYESNQSLSTTGNITGIYDMNSGQSETPISFLFESKGIDPYIGSKNYATTSMSGFAGYTYIKTLTYASGKSLPNKKYYDKYVRTGQSSSPSGEDIQCNGTTCYGDAMVETDGWTNASCAFFSIGYPFLARGASGSNCSSSNEFSCATSNGSVVYTRVVVVPYS